MDDIKKFVRDLNLNLLTNNYNIQIDPSKRFNNRINWFMPSRKLIDYITKSGGVLTGSRALRCFKINDKFLLERKSKDWDFIITPEMAFEICNRFNINRIPDVGKIISISNQRYWRHPDYSESYRVGPVDVQLIIEDELPEYNTVNGLKFAKLHHILNEKMKLITTLQNTNLKEDLSKNLDDMTETIIKFNCAIKHIQISSI